MIAIIGAGISGLSLAFELQKAGKPYVLFESSSRPGGYIRSQLLNNYLIEVGPNSILADADFEAYLAELNLQNEVIEAASVTKNRFIYKNGKICKVPSGPIALLFSNYFSYQTKKAILGEVFKKSTQISNESVYDFFTRRFTKELTEYAMDPFCIGIYAGNSRQLLIQETFPSLHAYEQEFGSILKGILKKGFGLRKKTISFKQGLQTLPNAIASRLKATKYNTKVLEVQPTADGIELLTETAHGSIEKRLVSKVVCCCTTFQSASVLRASFPNIAERLNEVNYAPMKAVFTGFKTKDVNNLLAGFGVLYPSIENSFVSGTIWNSSIFKGRCPEDEFLTTSFIGGMNHPEYTRLTDDEIKARAIHQLKKDLNISGEPVFIHLAGWDNAIPQYDLALKTAKEAILPLKEKGIYFASNWTTAISLSACVSNAKALAHEL